MSEQTTNHEFRAETRKVLNILTHSLYSNREIFLRELISNASDALDKLRFLQSQTQHEAIRDADLPLEIRISSDKVQNCLTITDTGIGMTRDEMIENLGTIAHSGSEAFLKEHTQTAEDGTTSDASNIIGRFGIGFYSVFMVADKVEVTSLSATGDGPAYRWISDGTGTFTVEEAPDQADIKRGTTIRAFIKEGDKEFLEKYRIEGIIRTHSSFIPFPILVDGERVNTTPALWREPKFSIKKEQYDEFYKFLTYDQKDPLDVLHLSVDAPVQFNALLFIPDITKDYFGAYREHWGLDLYARRVLIQRENKELIPDYLAFLKGVVDTEDLPLNISRETLQENIVLRKISQTISKQILSHLEKMAKDDAEKYNSFWKLHGKVFKLGYSDFVNRDRITPLLRFNSSAMEDADGFAAKLTTGEGNVFDGCIAAYNADDGWDLFAKAATGSIGAVTIQNCVAYKNGYLMLAAEPVKKQSLQFPTVTCDDDGNLSFSNVAVTIAAGNGNGFKMGGTNLPGNHKLLNSISYDNAAKGIDSNSCPDVKVYSSTSYNNEGYNVALYTGNKSAVTDYAADGVISFRKGTDGKEQLALQSQSSTAVYGPNNFYWDSETQTSHNKSTNTVTVKESWFESLDTSVAPTRNADGSINMHGLLLLTAEGLAATDAGARGSAWGQPEAAKATIWVVGDSTVSAFDDSYYLPREGYGEEIANYFNADVYNLAVSGASSKDFTGMSSYNTLMNGSDTVPALGDASGDKFLIIGFGHNDEKTEPARYTNPNGDYKTEGSFANSLYVNYIQPALERGVIPVVCTPIARLTNENTKASYDSASGHKTQTVTIGDTVYEGGYYAQAIRDMCSELHLICVDLTDATINENITMGKKAQYTHSFTGAKEGKKGNLVPTGLDLTHTNSYGAKLNAWLIDQLTIDTPLGAYSKHKEKPTYKQFYGDAANPDYVPSSYVSPTENSTLWPAFTDANGTVWNGSVFGNVGGNDKISGGDFTATVDGQNITLGVTNNRGKIASTVDGLMMYYVKLPAGTNFTLTAKATVNSLAKNNQVSFGLMARDEMYVDTSISDPIGDYVAVGTRNQGAINCFGRKSGELYDGPAATVKYGAGDTVDLKLIGTADGFTLIYGDNETASTGFDYALTAIDSDYIYVGFYVARNANVTFSDIQLTTNGVFSASGSGLKAVWNKVKDLFPF